MSALVPPPSLGEPGGAALANFCQHVRSVNPFTDNRINGPSANDVDVGAIHQAAFERLTALAQEALAARRGLGALLWGEAGIGKSHLLSRLGRWADNGRQATLVYLHNLQAAPANLPRSLLRAAISILTFGRRQNFFHTPLYELARAAVLEAVHNDLRFHSWSRLERAFAAWVDRLGAADLPGAAVVDHAPFDVLFRFFRSVHRARAGKEDGAEADLAVRWLSGQAIDSTEARRLGLAPSGPWDEPVALEDNQRIKQVLVSLTRLAAAQGQPFIFAFDQVDNLDEEQAAALARFLEALIDSSPNLLVVTAGIQATLQRWREQKVIQDSAWDRLAQFTLGLHRLTNAEALQLVRARLDDFLAPYKEVEAVRQRRKEDDLFPLGRGWYEGFLKDKVDVRPRDAVNWAREGWRRRQEALRKKGDIEWLAGRDSDGTDGMDSGGTPLTPEQVREIIDRRLDERLAEHRAQRQREAQDLPPDADHLAGLIYALLVQCRDADQRYHVLDVERQPPPRRGARPTYDLTLLQRRPDGGDVRTGMLVVAATHAVAVAGFLRRLLEDDRPLDRLLLVTDERVGLPLGVQGQDRLQELRQRGPDRFQVLELTFAEYAYLDALQQTVQWGRAGDLEVELRPGLSRLVTGEEVIDSHHRCDRYRSARLLRTLLGGVTQETT